MNSESNPCKPTGGIAYRLVRSIPGVVSYELHRSFTPARIATFLLMVAIPTALMIAVANLTPHRVRNQMETDLAYSLFLYFLIPQILTLLGMLVLASPIVQAELEGQSWLYSLIRYQGRRALLLGKYIIAVLWTTCAGIVSAGIAIPFLPLNAPFRTWATISLLCLLASIAYGSLFSLIGVIFQKRVMVISFIYAIVVEGLLAWIPAVINQFTISYRLRSILFRWQEISIDSYIQPDGLVSNGMVASDPTGWAQLGWVLGISAGLLLLALILIERIQYSFQSEL